LRDDAEWGRKILVGDRSQEQIKMNCPQSDSNNIRKNGHRRGKLKVWGLERLKTLVLKIDEV
jgi:hypothetical protein